MPVSPDKVVMTSALITLTSTTAASVLPVDIGGHGTLPSPRLLIGTALTFTGLSFAADAIPEVTTPLAVAIMFTALTYYGLPLIDNWFNNKHAPKGKKP